MSTKNGRSGVAAPKRPANKGKRRKASSYSQCKVTTCPRRFQERSNADALAAEIEYVREKNRIPIQRRGRDPETRHDLNEIRDRTGADGECWP